MSNRLIGKIASGIAIFIIVVLLILHTVRIPNGYLGIEYAPSGGVKDNTLGQGWHLAGWFHKVTKYPIRLQTVEYNDIQIATSDGKNITMDFAYNYQIEPDKVVPIFNMFGPISVKEIEDTYLRTRLWDAARKEIAKFTVIDIYGEKSAEASQKVQSRFAEDVNKLGFTVTNLTAGVPKPDAKTQEAIDRRVEATQELERKTTELEIAKKEAKRKREEAKGVADALVIEAEGISKSNKLLQQSITPELILYEKIKKWDGKTPSTVLGDNQDFIVNVK